MSFMKIPFLLVVFFLLMSGESILPFLFVAFALLVVLRAVKQTAYRFEPRPAVSSEALAGLRNDVAVDLLDVDDDMRLKTNADARTRFEAAGTHYTRASKALDRGVPRRDRDAVAGTLYRARYELEATVATLDGRAIPERPSSPSATEQTMVTTRQSRQRRYSCCGW
jgi:hypothetical protein